MHTNTIHQACAANGSHVLSEGTMDPREVLPELLAALADLSPAAHQQLTMPGAGFSAVPAYALDDAHHDWWGSETASALLQELVGALNEHAPEGFCFIIEPGDRFGFFPLEPPPRMLPGQEPYTPAESGRLHGLIGSAARATELVDEDELELMSRKEPAPSLKVREFRKNSGLVVSVRIANVPRREHAQPLVALFEGASYMSFHVAIVPVGGSFDVCLETLRPETTAEEITGIALSMLCCCATAGKKGS